MWRSSRRVALVALAGAVIARSAEALVPLHVPGARTVVIVVVIVSGGLAWVAFADVAVNLGVDDPDANFSENYGCGSPRNYSQYCDEQLMKMIEQQSQEVNPQKRLGMVLAVQKKLEEDAPRPILDWRLDYFSHWPYVHDMIPHNNIYNFGRMQDVWRDQ